MQHGNQQQIDAERTAVDHDKAEEGRCDNRTQPKWQPGDQFYAELMEPLGQLHST